MSFEPRDYVHHILAETEYLLRASEGLDLEAFLSDETLRRALVRILEIIGEAAKNLPESFRAAHPQVEWRSMARMRDRLIHGYDTVDLDIAWAAATMEMPRVLPLLEELALPEPLEGER